MSGTRRFPGSPMETINLFSLRASSSCPETLVILAPSHWQLPKLTTSPDVFTFLQPFRGANESLFIALEFAGPNRYTRSPFILTYGFLTDHPLNIENKENRKCGRFILSLPVLIEFLLYSRHEELKSK